MENSGNSCGSAVVNYLAGKTFSSINLDAFNDF
jgi:hypothetical protein